MELIQNKLYSQNQYLQEDAIDEISILLQGMGSQFQNHQQYPQYGL